MSVETKYVSYGRGWQTVYSYDNNGNILQKTQYNYRNNAVTDVIQSDISYGYTNSTWGDQLTMFNGHDITYDANGNPLSYYNNSSYTFTWEYGRKLSQVVKGNNTIQFTYDANGMRTSKKVNNTLQNYYYYDNILIAEECGGDYIRYIYDGEWSPIGLVYAPSNLPEQQYRFVKNLQGDILELRAQDNTVVARYEYDAWGALLSVKDANGNAITDTSHIAHLNSLRYRGYCYDNETGFYYLINRYYDPAVGRFLNADSQLNMKDGPIGCNMYAYCLNNPIVYSDTTGRSITIACIVIGVAIGAAIGGCIAANESKKQNGKILPVDVVEGVLVGGTVGGLVGWGVGAIITAIGTVATGSVATASTPILQEVSNNMLVHYYPPNNGFWGTVENITIESGAILQRTGELSGRFVAPAGTPLEMLSLPYDKVGMTTTLLQTTEPINVLSGIVAPWFGQLGGGVQYLILDGTVSDLLEIGVLIIFGG